MNIYRQGDVLLVQLDTDTPDGTAIPRENGKIVLAHGEVTGHAHAITEPAVQFVESADGNRYLVSDVPFTVRHEEHAPVSAPAGTFRVIRQREYTPAEIRRVAD